MAVLTREELLKTIKKYTENAEGEEVLTDVENIVDTVNSFDDDTDVEERIRELDDKWHKKFIEKFFSSSKVEEKEDKEEKEDEEEIFIEKED